MQRPSPDRNLRLNRLRPRQRRPRRGPALRSLRAVIVCVCVWLIAGGGASVSMGGHARKMPVQLLLSVKTHQASLHPIVEAVQIFEQGSS